MAKLTTNDVTGGYADVTAINDNNALIEAAVENTLSLDGTTPNSMSADFDMDSNNILNANTVSAAAVQIGGVSVVPGDTLTVGTAANVPNVPAGNIAATDVQSAINELDGEKMKLIPTPVANDLVLQASDGEVTKAGYGLPNINADITASDEELNYSVGVTSAIQTQLDVLTTALNFRGVLVYESATQSIPDATDIPLTKIAYALEDYDTDSIHDNITNNTRLTVPTGVTKVRLSCTAEFISNSTGRRYIYMHKNGSIDVIGGGAELNYSPDATFTTVLNYTSAILDVVATDYFETGIYQNSGGALSTTANTRSNWFAMEIIE